MRNVTQPIRFQGQWHDEESGLYYNRHRYYAPQQGRYISQDPIGLKGGTNLYGYVNNPMEMVDPLGLNPRTLLTAAQAVEKVRYVWWCIGQDIVLTNSRDQLPDILEEEMEAAEQSKSSGIEQCKNERNSGRALGLSNKTLAGNFNACEINVAREYNERVAKLAQRNANRHAAIDEGIQENALGCVMPNPADLETPGRPQRSR